MYNEGLVAIRRCSELRHTGCTSLRILNNVQNYHNITCKSDEWIYINYQTLKFGNEDGLTDERRCHNSTSTECFLSIPSEFEGDFTTYFNASQICNRLSTCALRDVEYYDSAITFAASCPCCRWNFYDMKIIVYFECLTGGRNILIEENKTVELVTDRPLYLMATKRNTCRIKGNIESGRILEQTNMNLTISQGNNQICSEILGIYHYNRDLSCIRGLSGIIIDFKIYNSAAASTKMLWIEIKGRSLQLVCGDITEALFEQPQESSPALIIAGPVVGVLLLGVVVLVIVLKRRKSQMLLKNMPKCDDVTTTLPPFKGQGGPDSNDVLKPKNEEDRVSSSKTTYYNMDIPECPLQVEDGNYSLISSQAEKTIAREKQAECHNTEDLGDGVYDSMDENPTTHSLSTPCAESLIVHREETETETTNGEQIIGEITGDVYASVCKVDKVENKQMTGPKGDIYATVSNMSSRE